jgi:hypothetical protein
LGKDNKQPFSGKVYLGAISCFPLYLLSAKEAEQKDAAAIGAITFCLDTKSNKKVKRPITRRPASFCWLNEINYSRANICFLKEFMNLRFHLRLRQNFVLNASFKQLVPACAIKGAASRGNNNAV